MKLIIASANRHKIEEIAIMMPPSIDLIEMAECGVTEDIPEDADTLEGNALEKMRYVYSRTKLACFADDTGLEVEALNNEPGVRSARYATDGHDHEANIALLLKNLKGQANRKAQFRTVIALNWQGKEHLFEGAVKGVITTEKQGEEGFGYDAIFMPEGCERTFAQMSLNEKSEISHRARATKKLMEFLCKQQGK